MFTTSITDTPIFSNIKKKSHINKIKTNNPMQENGRRNKILLVKITYKWYLNIGKDTEFHLNKKKY